MTKKELQIQAAGLGIKPVAKLTVPQLRDAIANAGKSVKPIEGASQEATAEKPKTRSAAKSKQPTGISQKLQALQAEVHAVTKTGEVAFGTTKYEHMQEHGLLAVVKPLLTKLKIGLHVDCQGWSHDGNHTHLDMVYTLFDSEIGRNDADWGLTTRLPAEGVDSGDKGINKALTNGLKYYLQKECLIPTDKVDDVEGSDEAHNQASTSGGTASGPKQTASLIARVRGRAAAGVEAKQITNQKVIAFLQSEFATNKVTDLNDTQAVAFGKWLDAQDVS